MLADRHGAVLVLVDVQPSFLKPIFQGQQVLKRCQFMLEIANLLEIPVITTEQYPSRMGGTEESLLPLLKEPAIPKMSFSCAGCSEFTNALQAKTPKQVVLIGIETHICVTQTALQLLDVGTPVFIGADAVSARNPEMHRIALLRMQEAGAVLAPTESIVYEWLRSADDPKFREALKIVKQFAE